MSLSSTQQRLPNDVLFSIIELIPTFFHIPYWVAQRLDPKARAHIGYKLLGNLALTSRFLRHAAQREMFKSILIANPRRDYDKLVYYGRTIAVFKSNVNLSTYVQACVLDVYYWLEQQTFPVEPADFQFFMGSLKRLDSLGLVFQSTHARWESHFVEWARQALMDCFTANTKTLKTFMAPYTLTFSTDFFSYHLPPNVNAILTDWKITVPPPEPSSLLASSDIRQPYSAIACSDDRDQTKTEGCSMPKILHFMFCNGKDTRWHYMPSQPDIFFSRLLTLTLKVPEGTIRMCQEFLRAHSFPRLQHLVIEHPPSRCHPHHGGDETNLDDNAIASLQAGRFNVNCGRSNTFCSLHKLSLYFERNPGIQSSMDDVLDHIIHCFQHGGTPLHILNVNIMCNGALLPGVPALYTEAGSVPILDEIFAQGLVFPELKEVNVTVSSRRRKTVQRLRREFRSGSAAHAFTQTKGSERVTFTVSKLDAVQYRDL
ncbi:hypothetical protein BKA70DRAFT_1427043 [Coprinopsis sp. MPI-PUGE-AT-0042]|nr:hypothetical protein BKA70DRAFT_1427043 [Coprinopsis sp. MPI-PUGE-AT-0042]